MYRAVRYFDRNLFLIRAFHRLDLGFHLLARVDLIRYIMARIARSFHHLGSHCCFHVYTFLIELHLMGVHFWVDDLNFVVFIQSADLTSDQSRWNKRIRDFDLDVIVIGLCHNNLCVINVVLDCLHVVQVAFFFDHRFQVFHEILHKIPPFSTFVSLLRLFLIHRDKLNMLASSRSVILASSTSKSTSSKED